MAYATVIGQDHHHSHAAGAGGAAAGGGAGWAGDPENAGAGGGGGGAQFANNSGGGAYPTGGSPGVYGPGEGGDGPGAGGFMPNGENGLLILADYARTKSDGESGENSTDNSDHAPGLAPGDGDAPTGPDAPDGLTPLTGDQPGPAPHGDGPAQATEPGGFGFGIGGFGGGGGGGAGGGSGSVGSGGGAPHVDPVAPPETNPILPDPGPDPDHDPGPTTGGGGDPKVCLASVLDACDPPLGDPPFTHKPHGTDLVAGPPDEKVVGVDAPGVPEPAAWLTMILGFGAAGAALRARRHKALA